MRLTIRKCLAIVAPAVAAFTFGGGGVADAAGDCSQLGRVNAECVKWLPLPPFRMPWETGLLSRFGWPWNVHPAGWSAR